MFSVEEAGKEIEQMGDEENLLQKFVDYIKVFKEFEILFKLEF